MSETRVRQRLSREERYTQLIEVARKVIHDQGTQALTLGHLAQCAGVTKPVVYDHFTSRSGLLAALYREYDLRQTRLMDEMLDKTEAVLAKRAAVVARAYIDCVQQQGREMPNVMAALTGTPELEKLRHDYAVEFTAKCQTLFAPFRNGSALSDAALWAMLGAAEGLSWAVVKGNVGEQQAKQELQRVIVAMVEAS